MGNLSFNDVLVIAATLIAMILLMRRSGESISHQYVRVHIRSDERYRRQPQTQEPAEEELNPAVWMEWFLFGSLLLVIVMMLGKF